MTDIKSVDAKTLKSWLDKGEATLIDVREADEHKAESIKGAKLIPVGSISCKDVSECGGKKLVIHCLAGKRGGMACEKLVAENPNLEVYNLEGGLNAWKEAGLETEKKTKCTIPLQRQVMIVAGSLTLLASILALQGALGFIYLTLFIGLGLTFAGITGICGLAMLLAKMPWNKCSEGSSKTSCCPMK